MALAYSYIRFSSKEQAKGDSFERQAALRNAYIAEHNLTLDDSLHLEDLGVSAFKGKNSEQGVLSKFLEAADNGIIPAGSYLLVESLDRLSRAEVLDAFGLFQRIINNDITIVTLADGHEYSKASIKKNFTELIISISVMSRAHEESALKSQRVTKAWDKKRDAAKTGKIITKFVPFWLGVNADKTSFSINEEYAGLVKRIFGLSAEGVGTSSICKMLNKGDITAKKGGIWRNGNVIKLLRNRAVIGEANFLKSDPIPNYFPSIISEELFFKVGDRLNSTRFKSHGGKVSDYRNIFRKVLKCPYCGGGLSFHGARYSTKGKEAKSVYATLFCVNKVSGKDCTSQRWDYFEFQRVFLTYVKELDISQLVNKRKNNSELDSVKDALAKARLNDEQLNTKMTNLVAVIEAGNFSQVIATRIAEIEKQLNTNKLHIRELELKLGQIQSETRAVEITKDNIAALFNMLGDPIHSPSEDREYSEEDIERRAKLSTIISSIVEKIEVYSVGAGLFGKFEPNKKLRFMIITFKSGVKRGLAHDGSTIVLNEKDGNRTWSGWNVVNGQQMEPTTESVTFLSERLKSW